MTQTCFPALTLVLRPGIECWLYNLNSNKLRSIISLHLSHSFKHYSTARLNSSLDCYIINIWFQLTMVNHIFKLLLIAPVQQEWVQTPFKFSSLTWILSIQEALNLPQHNTPTRKTVYYALWISLKELILPVANTDCILLKEYVG